MYSRQLPLSILLLSMIIYSKESCNRNPNFNELIKENKKVYLCESNTSCTLRYLTNGKVYFGCLTKESNIISTLAIYLIIGSQSYGIIYKSLSERKWIVSNQPLHFTKLSFISISLQRSEFLAVECGTGMNAVRNQFPDEGQPKYQFADFHKVFDNSIAMVYHSQTLDCRSYCLENSIKVVRLDPYIDDTTIYENSIHFKFLHTQNLNYNNVVRFSCGSATDYFSITMSFKYADRYKLNIWDSRGPLGKLRTYDVGETFHCKISFFSMYKSRPLKELFNPLPFIYVQVTEGPYHKSGILNPWDSKTVQINLNTSLYYQLDLKCYLGNYRGLINKSLTNSVLDFDLVERVIIKGKYETKLLFDDDKPVLGNMIEDGDVIKCDADYLDALANNYVSSEIPSYDKNEMRLSYIIRRNATYPLVRMIPPKPVKFEAIQYRSVDNVKMYFFCFVNKYYSVPRLFKTLRRANVLLINIFPLWNHEYSLPSFAYGCMTTNVMNYQWVTSDPDAKQNVRIVNHTDMSYLIINKLIKIYTSFTYNCTGESDTYVRTSKQILLKLIAKYTLKFNYIDKEHFYLEGESFSCVANFNVSENGKNLNITMVMPSMTNISGKFDMTDINKQVLVLTPNNTIYYGCCSVFENLKTFCKTWTKLKVVNSYKFQLDNSIANLRAGDSVSCYVCLNFSSGTKEQACTGDNTLMVNIGMTVIKPSFSVERLSCFPNRLKLTLPVPEYKPDGISFYPVSDFKLNISCCFRNEIYTMSIKLK